MNQIPQINEHNTQLDLFESDYPISHTNLTKSNLTHDLSESINIESISIELALDILQISKSEYSFIDIQELKSRKNINWSKISLNALNILIYYKQNSKSFLPQIIPTKSKTNWNFTYDNNKVFTHKIYPDKN